MLERTTREIISEEAPKNEFLWTLLIIFPIVLIISPSILVYLSPIVSAFITPIVPVIFLIIPLIFPIIVLYVLFFLTRDFRRHERREDGFVGESNRILNSLGVSIDIGHLNPARDVGLALYAILTLLTFGLFGMYWLYTLITEPNNHIKRRTRYQGELMSKLSTLT